VTLRIWTVLLVLTLLAGLSLCGCNKKKECEDVSDCGEGESCLFLYDTKDMRCAVICEDREDCGRSENCDSGAKTCPTCQDSIRICQ
jgi:hypothetical protein